MNKLYLFLQMRNTINMTKYPEKVDLLRDSIDVSGNRLLPKNTSDEEIDNQIDILLNINYMTQDELNYMRNRIISNIDYERSEDDIINSIRYTISEMVNIPIDYGYDEFKFWKNFGSAPLYQKYEDMKGKKGGIGMDTIFGDKFNNYSLICDILSLTDDIINRYKYQRDLDIKSLGMSKFNSLNELEENVIVKEIHTESEIFWNDESKDINERLLVFNKYGKTNPYLYDPNNVWLSRIYDTIMELDIFHRGENVMTTNMVDIWIGLLTEHRIKISHEDNKYHPKLIKNGRGYIPSEESIERLSIYYKKILMREGISSFIFDW